MNLLRRFLRNPIAMQKAYKTMTYCNKSVTGSQAVTQRFFKSI